MDTGSHNLFKELHLNRLYKTVFRPIIVADRIRTPENMGSILRLAGNVGVQKTIFISDVAQEFKKYKINKTASGAAEKVDWQIIRKHELSHHLQDDYQLIALETTEDASNLFGFSFPEKVAFVIGNEVKGISGDLLNSVHHKVYIPIPGPVSSLNVSHALSIVLFEWLKQMSV